MYPGNENENENVKIFIIFLLYKLQNIFKSRFSWRKKTTHFYKIRDLQKLIQNK